MSPRNQPTLEPNHDWVLLVVTSLTGLAYFFTLERLLPRKNQCVSTEGVPPSPLIL